MDLLIKKAVQLLSVKSIVTLILTAVFAYMAIAGTITSQDVLTIFVTVIGFYFGTQAERRDKEAA